jgi:hypothetical protein
MRIRNLLVGFLVLGGCATSGTRTETPGTSNSTTQRRGSSEVITTEELAKVGHYDLYAAISQLRPAYLVTRGASSLGAAAPEVIQVYVDGVHKGDLQALHQIMTIDVKEVRHLSATEATQRFGTGNTMGAIVVTRK